MAPISAPTKIGIQQDASGETARAADEVEARVPDFAEVSAYAGAAGAGSLDHLMDVTCQVSAELGRLRLPISDLLKVNVGSVLELDRLISEPVDVIVQGVRVARGEVVVVNDHFAVRIKEILDPKKKQGA